ncbi:hypothetical protein [Bifidobacterium jacchi]|uniref:hypothetical protein n=1 Tax=Bifidobacterium jacchi TaxID=2490545 RepID=UPI00158802D3|nr:hypothetical protein [Bifidobacterium jacchi]
MAETAALALTALLCTPSRTLSHALSHARSLYAIVHAVDVPNCLSNALRSITSAASSVSLQASTVVV